jgi:hypothetical protein
MDAKTAAQWMLDCLQRKKVLYQEDVVDYLIKSKDEALLSYNADGNQVIGRNVLAAFRKLTEKNVVWVRSEFCWRFRVKEDGPGRMVE